MVVVAVGKTGDEQSNGIHSGYDPLHWQPIKWDRCQAGGVDLPCLLRSALCVNLHV